MNDFRSVKDGSGVLMLVRETVDGLGRLFTEHLKLARLELKEDVRTYGRGIAVLVAVATVFALAYALACVGLAIILGRWLGPAGGFFAVAGGHGLVGLIAAAVVTRRLGEAHPMRQSLQEVERSVSTLSAASGHHGNGLSAVADDPHLVVRSPSL
jgi:Putative Actinobacterial Holin-X, holin superfamily III